MLGARPAHLGSAVLRGEPPGSNPNSSSRRPRTRAIVRFPLHRRDREPRSIGRADPAGRGKFARGGEIVSRAATIGHLQQDVLIGRSGVNRKPADVAEETHERGPISGSMPLRIWSARILRGDARRSVPNGKMGIDGPIHPRRLRRAVGAASSAKAMVIFRLGYWPRTHLGPVTWR